MIQETTPLVTAVIPAYNHEKYVIESIRSIIKQTYRNIELIIINDGSKDRTHERILTLVEECKRRFIRFEYIDRNNVGLSATLNQALSMARGRYFTALASDDIAFPGKIALLVSALEVAGPTYAAAFGNALIIDERGREICLDRDGRVEEDQCGNGYDNFLDFYTASKTINYRGEEFGTYETLIQGNYLPGMSNLTRTAAIVDASGWTAGNAIEDWEMWLKLARTYKFLYLDEPVAYYRWHELNTLKTASNYSVASFFLLVIDREKQFCKENGFRRPWSRKYNSYAVVLLRNRNCPFRQKLSIFLRSDKTSLLIYILQRIAGKLLTRSLIPRTTVIN